MKARKLKSMTLTLAILVPLFLGACSSGPEVKTQAYANEQTSRTMEYEYPVVWKGIKEALSEYRIREASEEEGLIRTDWAYSTSTDKYVSVVVNQQPRRKYLQTRYRFTITAKKQIIGVLVDVKVEEEIEKMNKDGQFQSWQEVGEPGSKRAHDLLVNIERQIQGGRHL